MLKFMCWLSAEHVMFLGVGVQRVPCHSYHANPGSLVVETRARHDSRDHEVWIRLVHED